MLKEVIKSPDYVKVAFFEAFIQFGKFDRIVDHVVVAVAVLDVLEIEEHLQIFLLLRVSKSGFFDSNCPSVGCHELLDTHSFPFFELFCRGLVEKKHVGDVIRKS